MDAKSLIYQFDDVRVDLEKFEVIKADSRAHLEPKAFEALVFLIEHRGRLVEKKELLDAVWKDAFVTENAMTRVIAQLRKALGDDSKEAKYIETVPTRGYRFIPEVATKQRPGSNGVEAAGLEQVYGESGLSQATLSGEQSSVAAVAAAKVAARGIVKHTGRLRRIFPPRRVVIYAAVLITLMLGALAYVWHRRQTSFAPQPEIKSLAVLPFKSLNQEAKEDYLGLGIANDIITKISQSGELTVRPTSAVRKYINQEADALEAAREQKVDAVLDGQFLHVGDQLRVSVNLLRFGDGASLWAHTFNMRFTDIFAIQDEVSQQVTAQLRLKLSPAEQARLAKRYTLNPEAYNYYAKAMYHFGNRNSTQEAELAIELFKKAIDLDPKYALARAQLGYSYANKAVYGENNPVLIEQAKQELGNAERLDPQLAEVHAARSIIVWSQYEGWQVEAAIRELRLAQQLNPDVGHLELADLYFHIGLEELAIKELEIALGIDPNSDRIKMSFVNNYVLSARPDEGLEASKRLFNRGPDLIYYLQKRMLKEAAPLVEQAYQQNPGGAGARKDRALLPIIPPFLNFGGAGARKDRALLLALEGKHQEAQAAVPSILEQARSNRLYRHLTYEIARIYALGGKSQEALKWLRVTVKEGFPEYPLFLRDSFLDPIRKDPAFIQFMAEMKAQNERYKREFA
jgi:DNA-binding winged helix-turn-helix (wHTH) protein/TolB-like protein